MCRRQIVVNKASTNWLEEQGSNRRFKELKNTFNNLHHGTKTRAMSMKQVNQITRL